MSGIGQTYQTIDDPDDLFDGITPIATWQGPITYSFPTVGTVYTLYPVGDTLVPGFTPASAVQQSFVRAALDDSSVASELAAFTVEGFTNLDISEDLTPDSDDSIRVANTTDTNLNVARVADFPSNTYNTTELGDDGDVWFGPNYTTDPGYNFANPTVGTYSGLTHMHELGHALGLLHGHENTFYGTLPAALDSLEFSVMTYRSYENDTLSGGYSNETFGYPQTWMMLDIAALQYMYGADFTANAGDTTYVFDPSSGSFTIDGVATTAPGANRLFSTIWDGNGTDTYDMSAYTTDMTVDLSPGGFSLFSAAQRANLGDGNFARGNIFNALQYEGDARSLIENAIGGSGNDDMTGNAADNDLMGGGGNDTLDGGIGDDTLQGEAGTDTFYISAGSDSIEGGAATDVYDATGLGSLDNEVVTVTVDQNGNGTITKAIDGGTDTFTSIETFVADETAGTDVLTLTGNLTTGQIAGISDAAVGTFTPTVGAPVNFGGGGEPTINDILAGGSGGPAGTYQITSGEEDGATFGAINAASFETLNFTVICYGAGTRIATPEGERKVEALAIGDRVMTAEGEGVAVKWIGRQTLLRARAAHRMQPVRIRAGALGDGLPHSDLTVTADHGMIVDGLVINASALVNGRSIDWVPMAELPERVTYYHIETQNHDVILANGAPAETFVDIPGRMAFDNYAEYVGLYGGERIIPEMARPRISTRRLLPDGLKARLGIVDRLDEAFGLARSA